MDYLTLPVISGDTSLGDALAVLRQADRSGVVANLPSQPTVVDVREILAAWRAKGGASTLGEIAPQIRTVRLPTDEAAGEVLGNDHSRGKTELLLDDEQAGYAVALILGDSGEILTRHEGMADFLRRNRTICKCTSNSRHVWLEGDLGEGGVCKLDGSPCDCA